MSEFRHHAEQLESKLIHLRRTVHQYPEPGFEEFATAKLICNTLAELEIPYTAGICNTGVVARLEGKKPDVPKEQQKTILIRADMDALPLNEETGLEFASKVPGRFHACGHDSHVACLLGAAEILKAKADQFAGTVLFEPWSRNKSANQATPNNPTAQQATGPQPPYPDHAVFQPAEEGATWQGEASGGALPMIEERPDIFGTSEQPLIDGSLALHIVAGPDPMDVLGRIGVRDGPFTGSCDEIYIDIIGRGGHASTPHTAVDPVFVACHVNIAIQGWLARFVNPTHPVVITFGKIEGGTRTNIIPAKVRMEGTLRTLNEATRDKIRTGLPFFVETLAASYAPGARAELTIVKSYPVGCNDRSMNEHVRAAMAELYDPAAVFEQEEPQLGSEDFFEFGFRNKIPIAMFWLGGANPDKGMVHQNHSNKFDYDEKALPIGTALLAATAVRFLNTPKKHALGETVAPESQRCIKTDDVRFEGHKVLFSHRFLDIAINPI